jgi:lipoprotein-anchoring transpeptidase ErfK/SrfK
MNKQYEALSGTFMLLSFVTAALLLVVQSRSLLTEQATATPTEAPSIPEAASYSALPSEPVSPPDSQAYSEQPASPEPQTAGVETGIKQILAAAHPVALMQNPLLVVDLSDRQVSLYQNDVWQASYDIAIGREGWETPSGNFAVLNMQEHPVWQNPISGEVVESPTENPLGSRWIGFWTDGVHQIGFHGTNQEESIGQAVSHGCIRMRDAEIQQLFTQVTVGTPVIVQP